MRFLLPAATALLLTAAAALSFARGEEGGSIVATSAWARATPPGATVGAAYVTLENRSGADDRLLSAKSPAARSVELHQSAEADGVATMRPLDDPLVPAGGVLGMQPGGIHLMLMGLSAPLQEGESVELTLVLQNAGEMIVELDVAPIGAEAPPEAHHDHAM